VSPSASVRRWLAEPWRGANAGRHTVAGLAVGVGTPGLILLMVLPGGWQSLAGAGGSIVDTLTAVATGAVLGPVATEIALRYLALRGLEFLTGPVVAAGITALLSGAVHLASPSGTPLGGVAAAAAGFMFGAAYLATRTMWLPLAIHIGWNLAATVLVAPPGPGANVVTILNCLVLAAALLLISARVPSAACTRHRPTSPTCRHCSTAATSRLAGTSARS
jgi:membrane protease YdiL (CAAX protease family)